MIYPFKISLPRTAIIGAALLLPLTLACSNRLKDYTQLTMAVTPVEGGDDIGEEQLAATESILKSRLEGLGIETAEIETTEDKKLIVRLPQDVDSTLAGDILINKGQLTLRNQNPDTEEDLAAGIETLQRLLVEQETLLQTEKSEEARALQADIDQARADIVALFEKSELTGDRIADARAWAAEDGTWAVNIQFDEEGTTLFANQTKLMAGTGRAIGLFLDDVLLSTPVVTVEFAESGITSGSATISGNFTQEAAKDLEIQLKSGALPVRLETVEVTSTADEETADEETADEAAEDSPDAKETPAKPAKKEADKASPEKEDAKEVSPTDSSETEKAE